MISNEFGLDLLSQAAEFSGCLSLKRSFDAGLLRHDSFVVSDESLFSCNPSTTSASESTFHSESTMAQSTAPKLPPKKRMFLKNDIKTEMQRQNSNSDTTDIHSGEGVVGFGLVTKSRDERHFNLTIGLPSSPRTNLGLHQDNVLKEKKRRLNDANGRQLSIGYFSRGVGHFDTQSLIPSEISFQDNGASTSANARSSTSSETFPKSKKHKNNSLVDLKKRYKTELVKNFYRQALVALNDNSCLATESADEMRCERGMSSLSDDASHSSIFVTGECNASLPVIPVMKTQRANCTVLICRH